MQTRDRRTCHADARPERVDLAAHRAFTFREDQHRPALAREIADVAKRLACARFSLRQGERVEEERRQIVVEAVRQSGREGVVAREEVCREELLRHEEMVLGLEGVRGIVIRPGIVYGGNRGIVADLLRAGVNGLVRIIGDGKNHWASVYDRDLADLYARLATTPGVAGIYHATDEADETVLDIVEALARNTTHKPDVRFVPLEEARAKMGSYADALALDQLVRSRRAREVRWAPSLKSIAGNVPRLLEEWRADHATEGV